VNVDPNVENSDAAILAATIAALSTIVYGIAVNLVQLVGAGAVIGVLFNLAKILNDRSVERRKRRNEGVQRLLPGVYTPLFMWAAKARRTLAEQKDEVSRSWVQDLPDLTENPEYNALVGDLLKNEVLGLGRKLNTLRDLKIKISSEYEQRLMQDIKELGRIGSTKMSLSKGSSL
jgi:hypothetical protein